MTLPLSEASVDVRLRRATVEDWPLIRRWLGQPEVIRWWAPRATTEAEVMLAMATPQAICRIIEASPAQPKSPHPPERPEPPQQQADARWLPVGYAHAIDAGLAGPPRFDVLLPGTWQIDLFVASPEHRGRGVGGFALRRMRDEVFGTTLAVAAAAFVAIGNEKAVRAYEQAGFAWQAVARDPERGFEWLMLAERTTPVASEGRSSVGGHGRSGGTPRLL